MTTLLEILGALVVIIMLARSLWLLVHTTEHTRVLSVSRWNQEADRASQRWQGATVPVRH